MILTPEYVRERLQIVKNDKRFVFYPETHRYYLGQRRLQGTTSFQKIFEPPFDEDFHSFNSSINSLKKYGREMSQQEVIALWREINKKATDLGHKTHEWIEHWLDGLQPAWPEDPEVASRVSKFLDFYEKHLSHLTPVAQEVMIFDEEMGMAGTFDYLAMFQGQLYVLDWKTNGEFSSDDEGTSYGNLLGVFSGEKNNKVNTYSIQTSIYRLMLERLGIPTAGAAVIHIPPDIIPDYGDNIITPCRRYVCKNYRPQLRFHFGLDQ